MSASALVLQFSRSRSRRARARRFNAYLLNVTFESSAAGRRTAVGGGDSVAEAIAAARGELPLDAEWTLARWSPVFGE
jgi:hypothetical protein